MERSKTATGSLIICTDIAAEIRERIPRVITRRGSGKKPVHPTLRSSPKVTPTLETMENSANADAQLAFGCVSMISRFSGVAKAENRKEKIEYNTMMA